jgi:hemolysin III
MSAVATLPPPPKVKPKLRGVSHYIAFCSAVVASVALVFSPRTGAAYAGGVVYGVTVMLMFGLSALYHRPMWSHRARRILRRVDHAGISPLIAGSSTAFLTLAPVELRSAFQLGALWAAAIGGTLMLVLWTDMPRLLRAGTYVAVGLTAAPLVHHLPAILGWARTGWVMGGAAIYILGAAVYARRWPNPDPRVFGYHEVFHLMVVIAAAMHYGVILDLHWNS